MIFKPYTVESQWWLDDKGLPRIWVNYRGPDADGWRKAVEANPGFVKWLGEHTVIKVNENE